MTSTQATGDRFEIVFDPDGGTAFVYRYVYGDICGPMTATVAVPDRTAAEAEALRHGLLRSGPGQPPSTAPITPRSPAPPSDSGVVRRVRSVR